MRTMLDRPRLTLRLDAAQRAAAEATEGNLLVLAGPGAGKTRLIIGRIAQLLEAGDGTLPSVNPRSICCITFTNKAADEITARLREYFPLEAEEITVKTFHGLAREIVREYPEAAGLPRHFHIIDEGTQNDILAFALKRQSLSRDTASLRRLKAHLDLEKGSLRFPLVHPKVKGESAQELPQLFSYYQSFLHEHGVLDFNDLLLAALQVLLTRPEARAALQARYRYLLLDEFQDVNEVQYELVRQLVGPQSRLLAVADGDQMIYGWRGSDARFLRAFCADFDAPITELQRNYRSEEAIQLAAKSLISHNRNSPTAAPVIPGEMLDKAVTVFHLRDDAEESKAVQRIIAAARAQDPSLSYRHIAILSRTHHFGDRIEKDLMLAGVPVQRVRKTQEEVAEGVESLIAYLRLSLHLFEWDLYRAMEYPRKLLSPLENLWLNQAHQAHGGGLLELIEGELPRSIAPLSQHKLKRFAGLVRELHEGQLAETPSSFFRYLIEALGEFRSPWSESEEALVLEEARAAAGADLASRTALLDFVRAHPAGRVLFVHGGTVSGALAALIGLEAVRRFLHLPAAIADLTALSPAQLGKALSGEAQGASCLIAVGLDAEQQGLLDSRLIDSGASSTRINLAPTPERAENFESAFAAFAFWAGALAEPLTPPEQELVFLDLETTSPEPFRCQILQVAAERIQAGAAEPLARYASFVRPTEPVPSKVQELTGITDALVASAPQAPAVLPEFFAFLAEAPVVGHNIVGFDLPILKRYATRLGNPELPNLPIDTWLWSKELFPRQNHSQEALCERFGLHPPADSQHHRADVDVALNRQLFPILAEADRLKRGICFSQLALVLLALASYQDDGASSPLRLAIREGAKRMLQRVEQDDRDIAMLLGRHFNEFEALRLVGLVKSLGTEPLEEDPGQDRFERTVAALREQMLRYEDAGHSEGIRGFLDFYYLLNDQDYLDSEDTVKVMTVHAAKGLEFQVVIIVGLEQGGFPHYLAVNNLERIEEERRLLYVALTRAKRKVYLTYVQARGGKYRPPSMFLRELPAALVKQFKSESLALHSPPTPLSRPERR